MKWIVFSIFFLAFAATVSVIDELSALSKLWANVESSLSAVNEVANIQTASTGVASTPNGMSQGQVAELFGSLNHFLQGKEEKKIISERIRPIVNESNTRLPQLPPSRTNRSERILVVYSGPTDVMDPAIPIKKFNIPDKKTELYRVNFEYFLEHGVQCKTQDTMLVVTQVIADVYRSRVEELHRQCQEHGHSVILALRNNTCLDLETVRVALYDGYVDVPSYDYFVYMNCGVTGPSAQWATLPWTDVLLSKLSDDIKMSGLTMNCGNLAVPHIQSMVYATDRVGLELLMNKGAIFDCRKKIKNFDNLTKPVQHGRIVNAYERKLSDIVLKSGYGISSLLQPTVLFEHNKTDCAYDNTSLKDLWLTHRLEDHFGKIPSLDQVIFFKTSRVLTPETAKQINYTLEVNWNW